MAISNTYSQCPLVSQIKLKGDGAGIVEKSRVHSIINCEVVSAPKDRIAADVAFSFPRGASSRNSQGAALEHMALRALLGRRQSATRAIDQLLSRSLASGVAGKEDGLGKVLAQQLADIREAGTYKHERLIVTAQGPRVGRIQAWLVRGGAPYLWYLSALMMPVYARHLPPT